MVRNVVSAANKQITSHAEPILRLFMERGGNHGKNDPLRAEGGTDRKAREAMKRQRGHPCFLIYFWLFVWKTGLGDGYRSTRPG